MVETNVLPFGLHQCLDADEASRAKRTSSLLSLSLNLYGLVFVKNNSRDVTKCFRTPKLFVFFM